MYPIYEVDTHINPATVYIDGPLVVGYLLCVDSDADTLTSEDISAVLDELRILHSLRVYRDFVSASTQSLTNVINCLDAAADCEWDENLFGGLADNVKENSPSLK